MISEGSVDTGALSSTAATEEIETAGGESSWAGVPPPSQAVAISASGQAFCPQARPRSEIDLTRMRPLLPRRWGCDPINVHFGWKGELVPENAPSVKVIPRKPEDSFKFARARCRSRRKSCLETPPRLMSSAMEGIHESLAHRRRGPDRAAVRAFVPVRPGSRRSRGGRGRSCWRAGCGGGSAGGAGRRQPVEFSLPFAGPASGVQAETLRLADRRVPRQRFGAGAALSGGLLPQCCPSPNQPNPADLVKPADSAEGAAARIKKEEADAKARRAAVRYLATVDCKRLPEAEAGLINALRADTNECVRFEAALGLGRSCCCTKKVLEALVITVSGRKSNDPAETSERVKAMAAVALERCLLCYSETAAAKPPEPPPPARPEPAPRPEPGLLPPPTPGSLLPPPTPVTRLVPDPLLEEARQLLTVRRALRDGAAPRRAAAGHHRAGAAAAGGDGRRQRDAAAGGAGGDGGAHRGGRGNHQRWPFAVGTTAAHGESRRVERAEERDPGEVRPIGRQRACLDGS